MNITIVGAGATGGYFGARLAASGLNVTFLVREKRAAQLREKGLVIKSVVEDLTLATPQIAINAEDIPACDLVLLGLKNYQLAASLPQLKVLVNRGAKILPFLNGVEHFEILAKELGQENVLGGVCKIISTLDSEGTIHHTSKVHQIIFGELEPSGKEFCLGLEQAMAKANFKVKYTENILNEIWSKYAFITVFSGVTSAGDLTTDQICAHEATVKVYRRSLEEMKSLADAYGVTLSEDFVEQNVEGLPKYAKGSTSSMHQDMRKGLPLEVESLQGAAIRLAGRKNMELPTIETLYGLIKPYEMGSIG
ncbi:ketopantoate reductase family protein [Desulfitobacterium hafniense]|uniref:ketopantoate reductase family protein n=1 Tax=Desulfitobacterium hafniense TaxID=49338 RepID=UPI0003AAA1D6|nr:ketopantoate reductase family protein [Desulfitobacterium hafniense]